MPKIVVLAARIPVLSACVVALSALAVGAAPAQVATAGTPFLRQAQAAGLTATGAANLQARVDAYRAEVGGVQTAANKIDVGDGATLWVTLPGEVAARDLDNRRLQPPGSCSDQHLCLWQDADYSGDSYTLSSCDSWQIIPWLTLGSYRNNQAPGTKLGMRYINGVQEFWTPAYTACSAGVHWENITYVTAC